MSSYQYQVTATIKVPWAPTYNDYSFLASKKFRIPYYGPGCTVAGLERVDVLRGDLALVINPYGYSIYRRWVNRGGDCGPWGGGSFASCGGPACWPGLHDYIDAFLADDGKTPVNYVDPEDMQWQTTDVQAEFAVPPVGVTPGAPDEGGDAPGGGYIPPNTLPGTPGGMYPPDDGTVIPTVPPEETPVPVPAPTPTPPDLIEDEPVVVPPPGSGSVTPTTICYEGTYKCLGTTMQKCISNAWHDYAEKSVQCGYTEQEPASPIQSLGISTNMLIIGAIGVIALVMFAK